MSPMMERISRRRTSVALPALMLGVALVLRAFSYTSAGLDWDESVYVVIAQRWLAGGMPYVAVWDQHPMGLPAIFTALIWLVGDGLLAVRIAAFVAVWGTAILLVRFLSRFAGSSMAGALAGLIYLFYMSRPEGLAANTEVFNNFVVVAASFLLFGELSTVTRKISIRTIFLTSLLLGIGLQIKYVVFPEAAVLCTVLLVWHLSKTGDVLRTVRLGLIAVLGGLLPTILMTLYFWDVGALQPYLDVNFRVNVAYITDPTPAALALQRLRFGLLPLAGLLPWPIIFGWFMRDDAMRRKYGPLAMWLSIWLVAACIDVALPMKFWKHYFNALIPPLCLVAGLAIVFLAQAMTTRRAWAPICAVAITLLPAIGSMVKHAADSRTIDRINVPRAIAEQIKRDGSNGRDLYVFNYDALVYAYADAAPPTPYVLGIELAEFAMLSGVHADQEIGRVLAEKPRWIVVADPSPYIYPPVVLTEMSAALTHYELAASYWESDYIQPPITVRLYRRADTVTDDNL